MSFEGQLEAALTFVRSRCALEPAVGVVLGSGLGAFAERLEQSVVLPYAEIPHFPQTHVSGHAGKLYLGTLSGVPIACLGGRVHAYEGHAADRVVFGVRLLEALGCRAALLTNAAGGIRESFAPGDLMLITDHLNLTGQTPLQGPPPSRGPRFPDMSEAYDPALRRLAREAASELALPLNEGVYAGLLGPSYETPAEVRMLATLGADAVGMSTVLEVIALRQLGLRVGAVSAITNKAAGLSAQALDHAEVQATAERIRCAFVEFLSRWATLVGLELPRA